MHCAGPASVLDYLGRYTHRVAMANHRLVEVHDGSVRFTSRDRRHNNRVQTMTLEASEFLRRFLLHVLPTRCMRIRHIGFLANRWKAQTLHRCRLVLDQSPESPPRCVKRVAEWMRQLTGMDITRCPHCGHVPLQRTSLSPLASLHGPPALPPCDSS